MSNLKLDLIHAFGSTCGQHYQNCVGISEEDKNEVKVVFPVGKAIAKKSIDRPEMSFVTLDCTYDDMKRKPITLRAFACFQREIT